MGEEIVIAISWPGIFWLLLVPGVISGIVALSKLPGLFKERKGGKLFIVFLLICVLCFWVAIWQLSQGIPPDHERALSKLQPIEATYKTHAFYLKESISEPGIQGEIKGSFGGFLMVSGSIYGKVDSGRVITVVYKDDDPSIDHYTGVHKSISFPLDEAVIVTIAAGEKPYLMYPEVKIVKDPKVAGYGGQLKLVPGTPHLYFPEGWKIL